MSSVRPPAAAGNFYPARADQLRRTVAELLAGAKSERTGRGLAGLVVPHAGYLYSGPVAATAYALLHGAAVRRVAILGPAHFAPLEGCAVPRMDAWRTPLGDVPIDPELRDALVASGSVIDDDPHRPEHAIEVQLPFLQHTLEPDLAVLPVAVGEAPGGEVAAVIETIPPDVLVVVSTDLSHYHDARTARRLDRRTADAILAREPERIGLDNACGVFALGALVKLARRRDLAVELLDLRTSADTGGDPDRVVGYGAFAFRSPPPR